MESRSFTALTVHEEAMLFGGKKKSRNLTPRVTTQVFIVTSVINFIGIGGAGGAGGNGGTGGNGGAGGNGGDGIAIAQ